jgi:glycosyltransferase involved in cell wall biosynthesis
VKARHTVSQADWEPIYANAEELGCPEEPCASGPSETPRVEVRSKPCISFWNKFAPPPWGGGNQFMAALMAEATRQGYSCVRNGDGVEPSQIHGHIVNSVQFDIERFTSCFAPGESRVLHRIDGPISILRGTSESLELDRACFDFNARYADATIIQSWHTVDYLAQLGLRPVNPALILNACDPTIFNSPPTRREPGERLRIIATSWSPSPGKGAAVYQWIDEHLDHSRYEFTFVGNCPVRLRHCRVIEPMASEPLAQLLRQHDVYITASRNDPCSNALIEAMSCGLPAIYLQSGGHPELVGFGGLGFSRPEQIPAILDRIRANYATYRALLAPESMADVCRKYMAILFNHELHGRTLRVRDAEAIAA